MIEPPNLTVLLREGAEALASGDFQTAEAIARRGLEHNLENEGALDLLLAVLERTDRLPEAYVIQRQVLAHFRALRLQNTIGFGLVLLDELGFRPRGLIDVGAYTGEFTLLARQFWPDASVVMIEPQAARREHLEEISNELGGDVHVFSTLVGDRERPEVAFHQLSTPFGSTGSSLYPETSDYDREVVSLPMTTVDALIEQHPGRRFDLLKVDVQGAELDVLRGAGVCLGNVEVVFAEVALHECNAGAPRLAELVRALDDWGFQAFDLLQMGRDELQVQRQVDAIFVHRDSPLWQRVGRQVRRSAVATPAAAD